MVLALSLILYVHSLGTVENSKRALERAQLDLLHLSELANQFKTLASDLTSGHVLRDKTDITMMEIVTVSSTELALTPAELRSEPSGQLAVTFEGVKFVDTLKWLETIYDYQHIFLDFISIRQGNVTGETDVRVKLRESPVKISD
jgi:type II secretory pathway component PulM